VRETLLAVITEVAEALPLEGGRLVVNGEALDDETALVWLENLIYSRHYCRWTPPDPRVQAEGTVNGVDGFVRLFHEAVQGEYYWDPGWSVVSREEAYAFVSNGTVMVLVEDFARLAPTGAAPGEPVHLLLPCARPNLTPAFFYVVGRAGPLKRQEPTVRLYMNLTPEGAPEVAGALVSGLGEAGVRFEAKFANDPRRYSRLETGVVYIGADGAGAAARLLRQLAAAKPEAWRDGTPLFAHPLGRGLAAAENPQDREGQPMESFGQHRCRLMAQGIHAALAAGAPGDRWLVHVEAAFAAEGVSLEQPFVQTLEPAAITSL
jgi:HopA1 effector protein family